MHVRGQREWQRVRKGGCDLTFSLNVSILSRYLALAC
jgi:hypothetical protein